MLGEERQCATSPSPAVRWICDVQSEKTLAHLLRLEKERRGLSPERPCFVGMSDLARGDTRTDERTYFYVYLFDRSKAASQLGLVPRRPRV